MAHLQVYMYEEYKLYILDAFLMLLVSRFLKLVAAMTIESYYFISQQQCSIEICELSVISLYIIVEYEDKKLTLYRKESDRSIRTTTKFAVNLVRIDLHTSILV